MKEAQREEKEPCGCCPSKMDKPRCGEHAWMVWQWQADLESDGRRQEKEGVAPVVSGSRAGFAHSTGNSMSRAASNLAAGPGRGFSPSALLR